MNKKKIFLNIKIFVLFSQNSKNNRIFRNLIRSTSQISIYLHLLHLNPVLFKPHSDTSDNIRDQLLIQAVSLFRMLDRTRTHTLIPLITKSIAHLRFPISRELYNG